MLVDIENYEQSTKRLKHNEKLLKEKLEVKQKDYVKLKGDNGILYTHVDMVNKYHKEKAYLENTLSHITQQNLTLKTFNQSGMVVKYIDNTNVVKMGHIGLVINKFIILFNFDYSCSLKEDEVTNFVSTNVRL